MIELRMQPDVPPLFWEEFVDEYPAYSIALDGCVRGGPRFDQAGPHINFNHHEDVDRLGTRSTCAQVLMAIRMGLFGRFRDQSGPRALVYANDCDEDVCTSVFLLRNSHLAAGAMNPLLNRLVSMEDMLDATAGAYPFPPDLPMLQELAWIFQPYRIARASGEVDRKSPETFQSIVTDVENRIRYHLAGNGGRVPLDTRYDLVQSGRGWSMVIEVGAHARTGMFADGIRGFVAVRSRPDGRFTYTVGRMSLLVPFDVPAILLALSEAEESDGADQWGGGDTIGGSPRVGGSKLDPAQVHKIVERVQARVSS